MFRFSLASFALIYLAAVAFAQGDFNLDLTCPDCPGAPVAERVEDPTVAAAGVQVWQCPECLKYYWDGAWHDAAAFVAYKESLAKGGAVAPADKCPKCGGRLYPSRAFVVTTDQGEQPVHQCYDCWTVVLPDGQALSVDELNKMEATRIAGVKKKEAGDLAQEYGWTLAKAKRVVAGDVAVGDEVNAVREAWGPPSHTERSSSPKGGLVERWAYNDGRAVEFKDGVVTALTKP